MLRKCSTAPACSPVRSSLGPKLSYAFAFSRASASSWGPGLDCVASILSSFFPTLPSHAGIRRGSHFFWRFQTHCFLGIITLYLFTFGLCGRDALRSHEQPTYRTFSCPLFPALFSLFFFFFFSSIGPSIDSKSTRLIFKR